MKLNLLISLMTNEGKLLVSYMAHNGDVLVYSISGQVKWKVKRAIMTAVSTMKMVNVACLQVA